MSYQTGSAASITALRTALLTHAQADGWVLTGNVLSKNVVFFRITETATDIHVLGCVDNAVGTPAPDVVKIGNFYTGKNIAFPCTYFYFGFAQEIYFIVNYSLTFYQWLAFGKSTITLPGTGAWCGASAGAASYVANYYGPVTMSPNGGITVTGNSLHYGSNTEACTPALFWDTWRYAVTCRNSWVHHGLDGHGWGWDAALTTDIPGVGPMVPLVKTQPNAWNGESVMLPFQAWKTRPSYKSSLVAELFGARIIRIDNLDPQQILTLGADKWMVFPWYSKNTAARDGGYQIDHSGTMGWAIKYEGP